jgi:hypothetical protein
MFQNLSPGKVAHYNKTTLKNLCIFHHFEKSSQPSKPFIWAGRPLQQDHFEKYVYFSPL